MCLSLGSKNAVCDIVVVLFLPWKPGNSEEALCICRDINPRGKKSAHYFSILCIFFRTSQLFQRKAESFEPVFFYQHGTRLATDQCSQVNPYY